MGAKLQPIIARHAAIGSNENPLARYYLMLCDGGAGLLVGFGAPGNDGLLGAGAVCGAVLGGVEIDEVGDEQEEEGTILR